MVTWVISLVSPSTIIVSSLSLAFCSGHPKMAPIVTCFNVMWLRGECEERRCRCWVQGGEELIDWDLGAPAWMLCVVACRWDGVAKRTLRCRGEQSEQGWARWIPIEENRSSGDLGYTRYISTTAEQLGSGVCRASSELGSREEGIGVTGDGGRCFGCVRA